jgi:hypothetical protein
LICVIGPVVTNNSDLVLLVYGWHIIFFANNTVLDIALDAALDAALDTALDMALTQLQFP